MEKLNIPTAEPFLLPGGNTGCVLIHGFTGTPKEMRMMGDFLSEKGITILGIRLAGHATQVSDMARTRWRDWLASVEDGINILSKSCDKVFLAGLSLGGALALMSASMNKVDEVIAMSTPYEIANDWRIRFAKPISIFFPTMNKDQRDKAVKDTAESHIDYPSYPTRSIAELYDLLNHLHNQLQFIKVPVLMINSKKDQTVPMSHAGKFQLSITSHNFETITLVKSGHVITEDIERDIVFNAALKFIQNYSNR
ncbi:MAG: alpha/beta fold hydrolase [Pelolinea sp.]|nr:alpha/beta fold hydrolase [Pelolinea sp.]